MSGRLKRYLYSVWPVRWFRTAASLVNGVRLSSTAVVIGSLGRFGLGKGSVVGQRCRIDLGATGSVTVDRNVWLAREVDIETKSCISIGEATTVQRRCTINGQVTIGAVCLFAPNVFVSSGSHPFKLAPHLTIRQQERRFGNEADVQSLIDRPVWIQDDCWLGANVVVCPGVTIGKGSIIGANSVVTSDVAPYSIVGGVPARKIGARLEWRPPTRIDTSKEEDLVYVLQGQSVRNGDNVVGYSVTSRNPFLAVVSDSVRTIEVRFTSHLATKLLVGRDKFESEIEGNVLVYDSKSAENRFGGKLLSISLPTNTIEEVIISGVYCV